MKGLFCFSIQNFCFNKKKEYFQALFFQILDVFPLLQSKRKAYQMVMKTSKFHRFISTECFVELSVFFFHHVLKSTIVYKSQ